MTIKGRAFSRRTALLAGLGLGGLAVVGGCGGKSQTQSVAGGVAEPPKTEFSIAWSIYAGSMPWPYAQHAGIVKRWADKYGIKINVVQINDYVEAINQYTAGKFDGVLATTMDALAIPAASGKDTTILIIGDYSNGNDGLVLKDATSVAEIKGRTVNLVELSVSHYLLARALETNGLQLSDVKIVNTGDADIVAAFSAPTVNAVATWNPQLAELQKQPGSKLVFDSSKIPNEILDALLVSTATLNANPNLGKALVGIWYETLGLMSNGDARAKEARAVMAKQSGTTPESFEEQLRATHLYTRAQEAASYAASPDLIAVTDRVRQFSFAKGLFGPTAKSVDAIGISFPDGKTLGDKANIKLRFDAGYMKLAADGKL